MGQCLVKLSAPNGLAVATLTRSYEEGAVYRLRHNDGPLSREEQAIDEVLGPLFHLALEARFGRQVCLHVFTSLTRVARLCLQERRNGPSLVTLLARLRESAWEIEELLDNFSSRGWLLRLLCTTRLDALVKWRLDDLAKLEAELTATTHESSAGNTNTSAGGASLAPTDDFVAQTDGAKQLALGLRNARRLQEALTSLLPTVMAAHGGAGNPSAMDAFMKRITPLIQRGDDPLRQLELHEETQIAVASLSVGPHRALRHPDLQYFWWRHMAGLEEVPWSTLWPHLVIFLGNTPRLSDGAGDTNAALELLQSAEMLRRIQAAVHRMGYANYVNVAELDMAFGSGISNGECKTLDEQLSILVSPGRPVLLARTSKGARLAGWMREVEARGMAVGSGAVMQAGAGRGQGAAVAALPAAADGDVTRQGSTANGAVVASAAAEDEDQEEEEIWFDAHSNFSRTNSSGFMSILGEDISGFWPGRMNLSRPVSQVLLLASNEGSQLNSRVPSAAYLAGAGPSGEVRVPSRRPSLQKFRAASGSGNGSKEPVAKPADVAAGGLDPAFAPAVGAEGPAVADTEMTAAARAAAAVDTKITATVQAAAAVDTEITATAQAAVANTEMTAEALATAADMDMAAAVLAGAAYPELTAATPDAMASTSNPAAVPHQELDCRVTDPPKDETQPSSQLRRRPSTAVRAASGTVATLWPAAPGLARLIGRDEDLSRIVQEILVCRREGMARREQPRSASTKPAVLLVSGPPGCGRTAIVTAAADRLVVSGEWTCAAFADLRCAAGAEDAALEMALALNVPFYATDRSAGVRLLSWLRTYGSQLRQGLVLDNVDLLMGIGRDEALAMARASSAAASPSSPMAPSTGGGCLQAASGGSMFGSAAAAALSASGGAHSPQTSQKTLQPVISPAEAMDRRRRVLRLVRDVVLAAPGLQVVMVSGPEVTSELLRPCLPQDLPVRFQWLGLMPQEAARQLLSGALGHDGVVHAASADECSEQEAETALLESQLDSIVQAANCLPGLLRMVARGIRCEVLDLATVATWAAEALKLTDGKPSDVAMAAFSSRLMAHSLLRLPPDAHAILNCLVNLGCPLEEEDVTAAAAFLGHPGSVRAGLCCLYDRGLLAFQDLNQRHDVVGHVRNWMLHYCGFMLGPAVHGVSMAGASLTSPAGRTSRQSGSRSGTSAGAAATPSSSTGVGSGGSGGGDAVHSSTRGAHENAPGGTVSGQRMETVAELPPARRGGGEGHSRRGTASGRSSSAGGRGTTGSNGERPGDTMKEKGIRLSVLVQHLDGLLSQVNELYANGCRLAALRVYNNSRVLADRALLLIPAWLSRTSPSSATAAAFAEVMTRHLNNICRHVLLPGQLARASLDLAAMVAWLPSPHTRLSAYVTAARAHTHLMVLRPASQQLTAADLLAQQLYPAVSALIEANMTPTQPRAKTTGGGGGSSGTKGVTWFGSTSAGGGAGAGAVQAKPSVPRVPPQVAQLALAHAELAAAQKQYDTASRHLETFLELLAASGLSQTLEGAQARMQLGDLCMLRKRPAAEAMTQYEIAATLLMQLYGQSHFRVGRAMLAAARCSPEIHAPTAPAMPSSGVAVGRLRGAARRTLGLPRPRPPKAYRPLEAQLKDCLYLQQLSQGKFNLDVAEVEVARGTLLCRRNHPDEALSCGLVALGIVLEILGDFTPQVIECLALVALALRWKKKHTAAADIVRHAHIIRVYTAMVAAAAQDASTPAAITRPRPTQIVVLQSLADAAIAPLMPSPPCPRPQIAAEAATAAAVGAAATMYGERPTVSSSLEGSENSQKHQRCTSRSHGTPRPREPGNTLLPRSPVVQVPLPDVSDVDSEDLSPQSNRDPADPTSLLTPSPLLVLLSSGDEVFGADDSVDARVVGGSPRCLEESPEWPSVQRIFSSRMAAANVVSGGSLVHHVSYPPPLAPADSIPGGFDENSVSPRAAASDVERQLESPATSPSSRVGGGGDADGGIEARAAVTVSSRVARTEPAASDDDDATAGEAATVVSPANDPTPCLGYRMPMAELQPGEDQVVLVTAAGAAGPGAETDVPIPAGGNLTSVVPSEMWVTALEYVADATGVELQAGSQGDAAPQHAFADARLPSATRVEGQTEEEQVPEAAVAAEAQVEEKRDGEEAAAAPVERMEVDGETVAEGNQRGEAEVEAAAEDPESAMVSARTDVSLGAVGMQLPFPPPLPAHRAATASAAPLGLSGNNNAAAGGDTAVADNAPWSTPVRSVVPHLHPSPLSVVAQQHTPTTGSDASGTTGPFSPGLSLPHPPFLVPPSGTSLGTASTFDVTATLTAAAAAAAAAATTLPSPSYTTSTPGDTIETRGSTPGSGTPLAKLCWSAYSPTEARIDTDSRALRGGIVFPTPSTTPGEAKVEHKEPWLSWATSGAADSARIAARPRELRFSDTVDGSKSMADSSTMLTDSVADGAGGGATVGDSSSKREAAAVGQSGQVEAQAEWALAASAAAAAALLPIRSRFITLPVENMASQLQQYSAEKAETQETRAADPVLLKDLEVQHVAHTKAKGEGEVEKVEAVAWVSSPSPEPPPGMVTGPEEHGWMPAAVAESVIAVTEELKDSAVKAAATTASANPFAIAAAKSGLIDVQRTGGVSGAAAVVSGVTDSPPGMEIPLRTTFSLTGLSSAVLKGVVAPHDESAPDVAARTGDGEVNYTDAGIAIATAAGHLSPTGRPPPFESSRRSLSKGPSGVRADGTSILPLNPYAAPLVPHGTTSIYESTWSSAAQRIASAVALPSTVAVVAEATAVVGLPSGAGSDRWCSEVYDEGRAATRGCDEKGISPDSENGTSPEGNQAWPVRSAGSAHTIIKDALVASTSVEDPAALTPLRADSTVGQDLDSALTYRNAANHMASVLEAEAAGRTETRASSTLGSCMEAAAAVPGTVDGADVVAHGLQCDTSEPQPPAMVLNSSRNPFDSPVGLSYAQSALLFGTKVGSHLDSSNIRSSSATTCTRAEVSSPSCAVGSKSLEGHWTVAAAAAVAAVESLGGLANPTGDGTGENEGIGRTETGGQKGRGEGVECGEELCYHGEPATSVAGAPNRQFQSGDHSSSKQAPPPSQPPLGWTLPSLGSSIVSLGAGVRIACRAEDEEGPATTGTGTGGGTGGGVLTLTCDTGRGQAAQSHDAGASRTRLSRDSLEERRLKASHQSNTALGAFGSLVAQVDGFQTSKSAAASAVVAAAGPAMKLLPAQVQPGSRSEGAVDIATKPASVSNSQRRWNAEPSSPKGRQRMPGTQPVASRVSHSGRVVGVGGTLRSAPASPPLPRGYRSVSGGAPASPPPPRGRSGFGSAPTSPLPRRGRAGLSSAPASPPSSKARSNLGSAPASPPPPKGRSGLDNAPASPLPRRGRAGLSSAPALPPSSKARSDLGSAPASPPLLRGRSGLGTAPASPPLPRGRAGLGSAPASPPSSKGRPGGVVVPASTAWSKRRTGFGSAPASPPSRRGSSAGTPSLPPSRHMSLGGAPASPPSRLVRSGGDAQSLPPSHSRVPNVGMAPASPRERMGSMSVNVASGRCFTPPLFPSGADTHSDAITPTHPLRPSYSASGGVNAAGVAGLSSTSAKKQTSSASCRIPMPPSGTGTGGSQRSNRSISRIPTPPQLQASNPSVGATTGPTPSPSMWPPKQRWTTAAVPEPTAAALSGSSGGAAVPVLNPNDPVATAAWTLYSSPAYGIPDNTSSPPRAEADTSEIHDGAVSSPAARYAGSYTAAYLMRARAKSASMAAWGTSGKSDGGTCGNGGGDSAKQGSVEVGLLTAGAAVEGNPCHPRDGVKMHNPLFVRSNTQSLGGDVTGSSYGFEHDDDDAGLVVHSGDVFRRVGGESDGDAAAGDGRRGGCRTSSGSGMMHISRVGGRISSSGGSSCGGVGGVMGRPSSSGGHAGSGSGMAHLSRSGHRTSSASGMLPPSGGSGHAGAISEASFSDRRNSNGSGNWTAAVGLISRRGHSSGINAARHGSGRSTSGSGSGIALHSYAGGRGNRISGMVKGRYGGRSNSSGSGTGLSRITNGRRSSSDGGGQVQHASAAGSNLSGGRGHIGSYSAIHRRLTTITAASGATAFHGPPLPVPARREIPRPEGHYAQVAALAKDSLSAGAASRVAYESSRSTSAGVRGAATVSGGRVRNGGRE